MSSGLEHSSPNTVLRLALASGGRDLNIRVVLEAMRRLAPAGGGRNFGIRVVLEAVLGSHPPARAGISVFRALCLAGRARESA